MMDQTDGYWDSEEYSNRGDSHIPSENSTRQITHSASRFFSEMKSNPDLSEFCVPLMLDSSLSISALLLLLYTIVMESEAISFPCWILFDITFFVFRIMCNSGDLHVPSDTTSSFSRIILNWTGSESASPTSRSPWYCFLSFRVVSSSSPFRSFEFNCSDPAGSCIQLIQGQKNDMTPRKLWVSSHYFFPSAFPISVIT